MDQQRNPRLSLPSTSLHSTAKAFPPTKSAKGAWVSSSQRGVLECRELLGGTVHHQVLFGLMSWYLRHGFGEGQMQYEEVCESFMDFIEHDESEAELAASTLERVAYVLRQSVVHQRSRGSAPSGGGGFR